MLDVIPAAIQVKPIRRPRYGRRACKGGVVQALAPPRLVDGGTRSIRIPTSRVLERIVSGRTRSNALRGLLPRSWKATLDPVAAAA